MRSWGLSWRDTVVSRGGAVFDDDLPPDVLELLHGQISGLIELDVLVCMRSDPTRAWTALALSEQLGLPEAWTEEALAALCAAELVVDDRSAAVPRFRYHPTTLALEAAATTLVEVYEERPAYVARLLTESAISRVRWSASQVLPAAFVVRNEKD
jgi:hypothetical protein